MSGEMSSPPVMGDQMSYPDVSGYLPDAETAVPLFLSDFPRSRKGRPLRVAHAGPSFVCAGVESWLRTLVTHSDRSKIEFVGNVVTEDYAVDVSLLQRLGVPFEVGSPAPVRELARTADILLVWGSVDPQYLRPEGARAKVVFVAHGMGEGTRRALETCRPAVDHVVAVSPIVDWSLESDLPVTVILNGIDQAHIACRETPARVRHRLGFRSDDFVVGFVGRMSPEKRADLVIDSVHRLTKVNSGMMAHREAKALLVGWGPLRHELLEQCNEQLPGRFAFSESTSFLGDYYQVMDALCMPSEEEGFGLVLAEAMFHGVPVISTPVGIADYLVEDWINGLICDADPDEITSRLVRLREYPEWADGIGMEARRTIEQHCLGLDMVDQYQALFQELANSY